MSSLFLFPIEQKSYAHNDRENDKVEEHGECKLSASGGLLIGADAVGVDGHEHHKERGDGGEDGHYDVLKFAARLALLHDIDDKDGNIEGVECDDGKLRGIEAEGAEDGRGEIRAVEVEEPEAAHKESDDAGVIGHIGTRIKLGEDLGARSVTSDGKRVEGAGGGKHKAVERAEAGYDHEYVEKRASHVAKEVLECGGRALIHECADRRTAGQADEIGDIDHHNDNRTKDECDGKILLGIFKLGVDRGGDDPAVVCEYRRTNAREDAAEVYVGGRRGIHEGVNRIAVDKTCDSADNHHYRKGNELDDRRADLELTCKLRRQDVESV